MNNHSAQKNTQARVKVVLLDFDGTLSTLRAGWEEVMAPLMLEVISGPHPLTASEEEALTKEIAEYIDQSTGIQTVYQMMWLADKVRKKSWNPVVLSEWGYKEEYNRRLLMTVNERLEKLERGELQAEDYLMKGSIPFLEALQTAGIAMYVASGTDHPDVVREAKALGVYRYFKEIAGAPVGKADCSKEKVIRDLLENPELNCSELAVIGDGKVEIRLAKEYGSLALGIASDENAREGINPVKENRLMNAGADWIAGDYQQLNAWLERLGL
ncbi:HAD family hydrolase [Paenibacillus cremeus]|uniref:HAD family hydrolase n=1 Tax=Paenibacillus cremeus TaxID=2163881 RepID=A0A559K7R6_9BACL|nr:HAD family hydrolase [Paenibacillus cremeus]TVY08167.1 HAD family hydrolase [Paenibacillus cremeus]